MENNRSIIFLMPEGIERNDVINQILSNNGLPESNAEYSEKRNRGLEPRFLIIRDAAIAMAQHPIPDEKVVALLQDHLKTSPEVARRIVEELKTKLIPYAKLADYETGEIFELSGEPEKGKPKEEYNKDRFKESLLSKVRSSAPVSIAEPEKPKPAQPNLKKPSIQSVEKNAEAIKGARQPIVTDFRRPSVAASQNPNPGQPNPTQNPSRPTTSAPKTQPPAGPAKPQDPYKEAVD
jgi:hypothetical protein